jgi:hypothetical protein
MDRNQRWSARLTERIDRQKRFFARTGGSLVLGPRPENLTPRLTMWLHDHPVDDLLKPHACDAWVATFLAKYRDSLATVYEADSDVVAHVQVYAGIGSITGAMSGEEVHFASGAAWCEPGLGWNQIESLRFDPENPWIRLAVELNRALIRQWEGEFALCPYIYRSPLDAANGIRGSELFADLYDHREPSQALLQWCVDWAVQMESHLREQAPMPAEMERAVWACWMPRDGVFVNGDPVGMISRESREVFEGRYTADLFTRTGGGFFHNHSMGIHQVDLVATTPGLHIQEIIPDMDRPNTVRLCLDDPTTMARVLLASQRAPLMLDVFPLDLAERFLSHCRAENRLVLSVTPSDAESVQALRTIGNDRKSYSRG